MFSANSPLYAAVAIAIVIVAVLLIKLCFQPGVTITDTVRHLEGRLHGRYRSSRFLPILLALVTVAAWLSWRYWSMLQDYHVPFRFFYIAAGGLFLVQLLLASTAKPFRHRRLEHDEDLHVAVIIPVYNESETSLRECLDSIICQTRTPEEIHVVNDGSNDTYPETQKWFEMLTQAMGVRATWTHQENQGKRRAHATALDSISHSENMIVVTVDSDGVLDPYAVEEGLKPFHDPEVQSVAGIVLAKNAQKNFLSRITDLLFVASQQLVDRAAMSQLGSVIVNSGGLAFYRAPIVHKALQKGYTDERFFGLRVHFSDDSFLTLFALAHGKTVQQPTAMVFADMPVNMSHHVRQQLRWMRGSFIRAWWRIKHLPVFSWGFFRQVLGWAVFAMATIVFLQLLVFIPLLRHTAPPFPIILIPIILGYFQCSRYFAIKRSDMSNRSQLFIFVLAPFATVWSIIVLRGLRLYALVTWYQTGWGTRQEVEIVHSNDLD
ncbi:MAG TPA: glycosyltransferase [Candidatus Saccharimonadales bacterium]|nr:glycosyltransferase [Candidatus Saccharimonadales bacterium]